MKVIINTINIYHIHDNRYHIDNRRNGNSGKNSGMETNDDTYNDLVPHVVINAYDGHNPLILELKARILQCENEVKDLLDKFNKEEKES